MTVAMIMQVVMMLVVIVMINTRYLPHHQVAVILEYNSDTDSCISYTFSTDSNLSSVIGRESPCMTFFKSRVPDLK